MLRLVEQTTARDDPDPKRWPATDCWSRPAAPETLPEQVWLRFVANRPVSPVTIQYLAWCCAAGHAGKTV